jgi:hypothetical protein
MNASSVNVKENNLSALDSVSDSLFGYPIIEYVESALVLHEWPDDFLRQKIVCAVAPQAEWSARDEWDGGGKWGWQRVEMDVATLRTAFATPTINPKKGGNIFSPCELVGRSRKKDQVKAIYAMTFDVDNGQTEEDLIRKLEDFGACFVTYTSHSNGKASDSVPLKKLQAFDPSISGNPSDDDLRRFLAAPRHKDGSGNEGVGLGYWPSLVASARISNVDGGVIHFAHDHMTKLRIVIPLAMPFVIDESNRLKAERDWKAAYIHIANKIGVSYDRSCTDITRGFYAARTKSLDNYRSIIGGTTPLVFPEITHEMLREAGLSSRSKKTKNHKADIAHVEGQPDFDDLLWRHGSAFDISAYIDALDWPMKGPSDPFRKTAIECPNDDAHTSSHWPNDTGCVVMPPDVADSGKAMIVCQHDGCKQREFSTADYLRMIWQRQNASLAEGSDPLPAPEAYIFDVVAESEQTEESATPAPTPTPEPSKSPEPARAQENQPSPKKRFAQTKKLLDKTRYTLLDDKDGTRIETLNKDGDPVWVCQPFEVLGSARTGDSSGWGLLIEFYDDDGKQHQALINMQELQEKPGAVRGRLAKDGFDIYSNTQTRLFENLLVTLRQRVSVRILTVNRPGWIDDRSYVAPDGAAYGQNNDPVRYDNPPLIHSRAGTLDGQRAAFNIALTHGGAHHLVGILGGCAGVLVDFIELDTNPIVALTGESRHGKSTAMYLAASAFGLPAVTKGSAASLIHSLDGTTNAAEAWAEMSSGSFLGLDEAQLYEGNLQKLVFKIASGSGRGRLDQNANLKKTRGWRCFTIISGERGTGEMVEKFQKEHAAVGMTARLTDIDVTNERYIPHEEMARFETLLKANYGHAGPKFVEHLISSGKTPETIHANINSHVRELVGSEASPLIRSASRVFGLLWEVGDIMQDAGLLPKDFNVAERIKAVCVGYLSSAEAEALSPAQKAIETLREKLFTKRGNGIYSLAEEAFYGEALAWWGEKPGTKKGELVMTFYVRASKISELAGGTLKQRALAAALKSAGIAIPATNAILHSRLPNGAPVSHYRLEFTLEPGFF